MKKIKSRTLAQFEISYSQNWLEDFRDVWISLLSNLRIFEKGTLKTVVTKTFEPHLYLHLSRICSVDILPIL